MIHSNRREAGARTAVTAPTGEAALTGGPNTLRVRFTPDGSKAGFVSTKPLFGT